MKERDTSASDSDSKSAKSSKTVTKAAKKDPDDDDNDKLPSTFADWLQRLTNSGQVPQKPDTNKVEAAKPEVRRPDGTTGGLAIEPKKADVTKVEQTKTGAKKLETQVVQQPKIDQLTSGTTKKVTETVKTEASKTTAKTSPVATARPIEMPTLQFGRPEMLASGISQRGLEHAEKLGFQPNGNIALASAGIGATRLLAPPGATEASAREMLKQAAPESNVAANMPYHLVRPANGTSRAEKVPAARAMATPCGTDRCYGPSAIKWTPDHQACAVTTRIGVIDTGIDAGHPSLREQRILSRGMIQAKGVKAPNWHGTGVVSLLAGDPKSSTPGLVPHAQFLVTDIFYADQNGQPTSDTASLIQALDWLDKHGAQIINMSLSGPPDSLLLQAITGLSRKGIMFVAAAGNDGANAPPSYPAAYEPVIAVTAVNNEMRNYRHAGRGAHIDLAAPGVDIWTAQPAERAGYQSGTSFAVPYVTAVLASMYSSLRTKTKAEFLNAVPTTDLGAPGRDPIYGNGLVTAPSGCGPSSMPVAASALTTSTLPQRPPVAASSSRMVPSFTPSMSLQGQNGR